MGLQRGVVLSRHDVFDTRAQFHATVGQIYYSDTDFSVSKGEQGYKTEFTWYKDLD